MPALVAVRHNPHFHAFYRRLLAKGKLKMVVLVAIMRKLLHGIYGIFNSNYHSVLRSSFLRRWSRI